MSLDFSISDLNKLMVLYHKDELNDLLQRVSVVFKYSAFINRKKVTNGKRSNQKYNSVICLMGR